MVRAEPLGGLKEAFTAYGCMPANATTVPLPVYIHKMMLSVPNLLSVAGADAGGRFEADYSARIFLAAEGGVDP